MPAPKPRPAVFDVPSTAVLLVSIGTALTLSFFLFPFLFGAFGPDDTPFRKPMELVWLSLLAAAFLPAALAIVIVRRAALKLVGK